MDSSQLTKYVLAINNPRAYGYSYVQDFADSLFADRETLGINNIVVVWNIKYSFPEVKSLCYFSNNQKINLDSFDLLALGNLQTCITSEEDEFEQFRTPRSFASSHIIAIPINHDLHQNKESLILNGVILLFSQMTQIDINDDQLSILYSLLNIRRPVALSSDVYQSAIKKLTSHETSESFAPKYFQSIGMSLDTIAGKNEISSSQSGIRHFSLWDVVDKEGGSFSLDKEFNRNTYNDKAHSVTHTCISHETKHFLADVLHKEGTDFPDGASILSVAPFSEVKKSIKGSDYYSEIGLNDETCTVVFVSYRHQNEKKIACLYIFGFPYSVFVSSELICSYVKSLCDYINHENIYCQNRLFNELINSAFVYKSEDQFYAKASSILKSVNEASDCLIYMINEKGTFSLKSEKAKSSDFDNREGPYFSSKNLPERFLVDESFCSWLDDHLSGHLNLLNYHTNDNSAGLIKSALIVPVSASEGRELGVVILINKCHTPSSNSVFYNNRFIKDNELLSRICGMVFTQYQQLCNSVANRNYILKKLRHEIPSNSGAIRTSIDDLVNGIKEDPSRTHYLLTIANNIGLNNSRIFLLADYFTTVDFPPERFAEDRINVNINRFLNSYIDIFRTEGYYSGVDVYFKVYNQDYTISVSNYYLLAIVNIVINGIRYASPGTTVNIEVTEGSITVTDIGIPILESEVDRLFEEGFRGKEARRVNEKGMGYGLYLSKMILEAHGSSISSHCSLCAQGNIFAQRAVSNYIQSLPSQIARNEIIHRGISPNEYDRSDKLLSRISMAKIDSDYQKFLNYKVDVLQKWMEYNKPNNYEFIDMEYEFFSQDVYEVSFTIEI